LFAWKIKMRTRAWEELLSRDKDAITYLAVPSSEQ
jgi:hypothetical protein